MDSFEFQFITIIANIGVLLVSLYYWIQKRDQSSLLILICLLLLYVSNLLDSEHLFPGFSTLVLELMFYLLSFLIKIGLFGALIALVFNRYSFRTKKWVYLFVIMSVLSELIFVIALMVLSVTESSFPVLSIILFLVSVGTYHIFLILLASGIYRAVKSEKSRQSLWAFQFAAAFIVYSVVMVILSFITGDSVLPALIDALANCAGGGFIAFKLLQGISAHSPLSKTRLLQKKLNSYGLSVREREVLMLLLEGMQYKQISLDLNISPMTVKTHAANIYKKTGLRGKTELRNSEFSELVDQV